LYQLVKDQLKLYYLFYETAHLNEEVNRT